MTAGKDKIIYLMTFSMHTFTYLYFSINILSEELRKISLKYYIPTQLE